MTIYWSATTTGFYDTEFAAYTLPADVVAITADEYAALINSQTAGEQIVTGAGGVPQAVARIAPVLTLAQSAALASVSGLTITLEGSITLAATLFPTDGTTQGKIGAVITTLAATSAFPGGGTSYPMKDATGAWHTFTAAEYRTVAGAISTYVAACDLIADGNPLSAASLPASSVTLAV